MATKPVGDRLLVAPIKEEETTKSGIILPETAQIQRAEGVIAAVGNGEKIHRLGLTEGQRIIFNKYAGDEIQQGDMQMKILNHDDILAVIE